MKTNSLHWDYRVLKIPDIMFGGHTLNLYRVFYTEDHVPDSYEEINDCWFATEDGIISEIDLINLAKHKPVLILDEDREFVSEE